MDWTWLLLLVCPLMMIFMMLGMRGGHGNGHEKQGDGTSEETQRMQKQLDELKAQNEKMRNDLQNLTKLYHLKE
ncbi:MULTISPECIES: DUF2933 domain-containing protein [Paenibacillus]|jgi:hypothetical protein|uniref:DUF2933 domain-containing protein n=1 Tax=Paenibacillus lautus TaxID=1401 RepID=A0A385U0G4_PAELA|nr:MULTISPECIES: DUF2933 domain-containing protein [Paenibacillus]AWP25140.1 hypothetical protein B9D94_00170 [Paenibacillus sp. Cedars]AYB48137.1 DUF2933 domain-containing protein [Paenibacillus lautus]MBX4152525.1 DUF2933 domain-containing protein [Paenibacillus lautus]VTR35684.1 Protein of uncharacterised function (DUF2933) [Actinobacillus pleuropneumoniae]